MPEEYKAFFNVRNPYRIQRIVEEAFKNQSCFVDGFYITVSIKDPQLIEKIKTHNQLTPLIVSSLFRHERKMNMCHARAKFQNEFEGILRSKSDFKMHIGFKKITSNVIFSQIYSGASKFKFQRRIKNDPNWHLVSFFAPTQFPPSNFILLAEQNGEQTLAMIGSLLLPDLFKVILKRIILTGHPIRSKKKKATVKFMFFNTEDIRYFMKNDIYTKKGLKGKIKEPVGTHGLMKATFNNSVKQSDTICMNLYKRVFPKLTDELKKIN